MNPRLGLLLILLPAPLPAAEPALARFAFEEPHMGTKFRIVLYAANDKLAGEAARAAFARAGELNRIMSDYDPASELMRLCARNAETAGEAIKVSPELLFVLQKAQETSRASDGAFDVTVGPYVKLWRLARRTQKLPDRTELADAQARVGYQKLELHDRDRSVRLLVPGMLLDLGGIAKGYAADEMLAVLKKHGIEHALVACGGDIAVSAPPPGARGWNIDIAPLTRSKPQYSLHLVNAAVSTSGDSEQFVVIDSVRYSHVVDPRTGLGVTGRSSVTVIARNGITSDSLTKAVMLMPPDKGLRLIESTDGAAALIVRKTDAGENAIESKRLKAYLASERR